MADRSDFLSTESGVKIDSLVLITGTGNKIDCIGQLIELNLFESIYTNCMSGNIVLLDTYNLLEKQPVCGQEYLFVRIQKPGLEDEANRDIKISKMFRVYKVEKVNPEDERKQSYILHFVTEDLIYPTNELISHAYKQTKPEKVIGDLFKSIFEYDDEDMTSEDSDYFDSGEHGAAIETSYTTKNFYIPNLKPFEAMNFLAAHCKTQTGLYDFLLFENNKGYRLASVNTLLNQDPVMSVKYRVKNVVDAGGDTVDPYENMTSPIRLYVDNYLDVMSAYVKGEFGVQTATFDLALQQYVSKNISYNQFLNTYKKSTGFSRIPKNDWQELPKDSDPIYMHRMLNFTPYSDEQRLTDTYAEAHATRIMQLASLSQQKIRLHMPGNSLLRAGRMLDLKYPKIESKDQSTGENSQQSTDDLLDKYLADLYLIISVRHKITLRRWDSFLDLSKDTLPNELPEHFGSNYSLEAA